jgi:Cytochrome P460
MKKILILSVIPVTLACLFASASSTPGDIVGAGSPIYGVTIPQGYRQWELIAVSQEAGSLDELRAILGNTSALKAYREGTLPFPDGTIIAKIAWKRVPSVGDDGALGRIQAFVPGAATTVQFMVKDSKKYATTGGWGFGRFINGKPVDKAQHETCFACHKANAKEEDLVFTRYAH